MGNIALNDATTSATLSPAAPTVGQSFSVTSYQTVVNLPSSIVSAAAALGNSSISGSATAQVDASGATPGHIAVGPLDISLPIPSPVPAAGVPLSLPGTPQTVGPFTASSTGITIQEDSSASLTLDVSGSMLTLTCSAYPNNSVPTGIAPTAPSGSPIAPVIAVAGGPPTTTTVPAPTTTVAPTTTTTSLAALPTVTGVSPTSGSTDGGTSVSITGTGFCGCSFVAFGSVPATDFTVNSDTSITASSPGGPAGEVDVTVTTPAGTSATSSADQFTYTSGPPTVTGVSPTSGSTDGGTSVSITGTGFCGCSTVMFGSVPATDFTVNSDTSITATSPAGSAGEVDVTVTAPGGTSATSSADQFTYTEAPTTTTPATTTTTPMTSTTTTSALTTTTTAVAAVTTVAPTTTSRVVTASSRSLAFTGSGPGLKTMTFVGAAVMLFGLLLLILVDVPRRVLRQLADLGPGRRRKNRAPGDNEKQWL
ncbi:MAG: IPT/TIG domain-containing protein [Acidimicrobiales bacterium]|nr:IPT/TIG domain-containing protein [Acidimicrobiales bacterium]